MPTQRLISAAGLWGCLFLSSLMGAHPTVASGAVNFTVTPWDSGLPSGSVIALAQSRDGYLWLGTFDGLARFDGIRFTVFDEHDLPGLSSGPVVFLFGDSRGNLWVGTDTAGSKLIQNGQVHALDIGTHSHEGRLVGVAEGANSDVWLATANGQLGCYRDGKMAKWGPLFSDCRALLLEKSGVLWLATATELIQLDSTAVESGKDLPAMKRFLVGRVDFLLASRHGGFWLLANGSILRNRDGKFEGDAKPYPWKDAPVLSACEDLDGNLVVGTLDNGVTWFGTLGQSETVTQVNGLSQNTALSLCVDREGSLWVGTDRGGLNRVKRNPFSPPLAARDWVVQSVCEDGEGGLWLGFNGWGATYWKDGVAKDFLANEGLFGTGKNREPNFSTVLVDRQKRVWVGTRDFGLFQLDKGRFQPAGGPQLSGRNVTAIYEDRAGVLWVGTQSGLARRDDGGWSFFTATNGLAGDAVSAIVDDAAGNLWVGTGNGLSRWRDGKFTTFHETNGLPSEQISALLVDSSGALWVGTRGRGLARFADGRWLGLSKREGLTINRIKYLAEDAQGALWIGSSVGLMRLERPELDAFVTGKIGAARCRAFGRADGLLTDECSAGSQPAAWRGHDGVMWFTTTRGLVSVNPAQLGHNTNQPPVMIESVLVDDVLQNTNQLRPDWPDEIIIPAGKERLEIRYTSLNLGAPDRAQFKYQLAGYESGWTDAGTDRSVRYPKLPPGQYRFHVKACNEDGVWNEIGASLAITVEPPFWRTWWFLTLSAACLLGLIVATVHFISTQKLQRQLAQLRQKEALEKERARIARDLHDQLGANLTQVSLLGEMVETDKDLPGEVEAHARQIAQTARATALALDEIVWAANPANDTLEGLVTYVCKYAQEYFALAGLSCRLEVPEQLPATPVPPDVRHNVFLAFKEAVNNVVKHAQATAVKVRLALDAGRFTFEIEDNGCGLPAGAEDKGRNGLRNMRKRMEDVGGEFSVGPAVERGTRVRLTAPIKQH